MKKRWWSVVGLSVFAAGLSAVGADGAQAAAERGSRGSGCEAPEVSIVIDLDPAVGQLPESIAVDAADNLYVSMGSSVFKVDAERELSLLATLPIDPAAFATGVKFGPDGFLYVGSAGFDPALNASAVWRVSPLSGASELVAALDPAGFPNDLAFDDEGNVYVTDPFLGLVWRIDASGLATEWIADPALLGDPGAPALGLTAFGADGIAFDRNGRNLYISNLDFGTILRIPLRRDGSAGTLETFASDPLLVGADGIAFDVAGNLYVAVNAQDRIAAVDRRGNVEVVVEGAPLDGPSSVAFGVSGRKRRTLYFTNFAIGRATGVFPGVPDPSIASIEVQRPGLPLP